MEKPPSQRRRLCVILGIGDCVRTFRNSHTNKVVSLRKMRIEISAARLQSEFVKKVSEISGQDLKLCYQCGKCSAGCPMSFAMDLLPNQIMRLVQLGLEEEIANSNTIWLCASCLTCTVRCPKGVDISRVMEALRLITLRKNVDFVAPSRIDPEEISELPQIALVSGFRKLTS